MVADIFKLKNYFTIIYNVKLELQKEILFSVMVFFLQTLTIHVIAEEGRGLSLFLSPFYHSHPLINIQTFICNFSFEMIVRYFLIATLATTRLLLGETYGLFELTFH